MSFEEWWGHQPTRETAKMFKEEAQEIWDAATAAEREACAKVCEAQADSVCHGHRGAAPVKAYMCAAAIRERA